MNLGDDEPIEFPVGAIFIKDPRKRRKCPLCTQNLYLYNLNYQEMMLMCENLDCDFPIGYEAMQVVSDESELRDNPRAATEDFYMYPVGGVTSLGSISSTSTITCGWSDPERLKLACEFDASTQEPLSVRLNKLSKQRQVRIEKRKEIENNLVSIKKLNMEMNELLNEKRRIKKDKWLSNLMSWQGQSGKKLLTEEEMMKFKRSEPEFALGELKISVNPDAGVTSVDIQILNK